VGGPLATLLGGIIVVPSDDARLGTSVLADRIEMPLPERVEGEGGDAPVGN